MRQLVLVPSARRAPRLGSRATSLVRLFTFASSKHAQCTFDTIQLTGDFGSQTDCYLLLLFFIILRTDLFAAEEGTLESINRQHERWANERSFAPA